MTWLQNWMIKRRFNNAVHKLTRELGWCIEGVAERGMDIQKIETRFAEIIDSLQRMFIDQRNKGLTLKEKASV